MATIPANSRRWASSKKALTIGPHAGSGDPAYNAMEPGFVCGATTRGYDPEGRVTPPGVNQAPSHFEKALGPFYNCDSVRLRRS